LRKLFPQEGAQQTGIDDQLATLRSGLWIPVCTGMTYLLSMRPSTFAGLSRAVHIQQ
jgi:hypothetical protein